jgi:hypothetical protein
VQVTTAAAGTGRGPGHGRARAGLRTGRFRHYRQRNQHGKSLDWQDPGTQSILLRRFQAPCYGNRPRAAPARPSADPVNYH